RAAASQHGNATLSASLAKFGGGRGGRGGFGGRGRGAPAPGALLPFSTLNSEFDGIVSTQQVGIDEAPTQAMVDTWEADCRSYNATVTAWNTRLTRSALRPLGAPPAQPIRPGCSFAPAAKATPAAR
ncbi:MAG: hypothetical protein ACRD01_07055, partial [Terriglobales bacterium]